MSEFPYYAYQLLPSRDLPELFDRSLTLGGLVSQGRKKWPLEWAAVSANFGAMHKLLKWALSERPDDGELYRIVHHLGNALADKSGAPRYPYVVRTERV